MEKSFHYYGTYCAAYLAGYSHEESLDIGYSAYLVDMCSKTFLQRSGAPLAAATTQLAAEMAQARTDPAGLADITRIWAAFHFLPHDLHAKVDKGGKRYRNKYRMICGPNGSLLVDTVDLAKGKGAQAAGLAMHVLADTWAHRYFAGTPSLVINNTNRYFVELLSGDGKRQVDEAEGSANAERAWNADQGGSAGGFRERAVTFRHNPKSRDDVDAGVYVNSVYQASESGIMNLGHGRAGHLPDYSFARYRYVPAWAEYEEVLKDNPAEYYQAFCQMVYALGWLRDPSGPFQTNVYDTATVAPYEQTIRQNLEKRQLDDGACADWRAFGESLSGQTIDDFRLDAYEREYREALKGGKDETFLGKFILAALAQKGMVVNRVWSSGNPLAGRSIDYNENGFAGIKDFLPLVSYLGGGGGRG